MDLYQQYIHKSRYSRYLDDKKRRETWEETVDRYCDFFEKHLLTKFNHQIEREEIKKAILNMEVMPSMRALMTAGKALERDNTAGYNCAFVPVDDPKAFDEALHILACGTGVGFSVESHYVDKLPEIPEKIFNSDTVIVVKDSKEGWAKAFRQLISLLYAGEAPCYDLSKIRPKGARLKTFGGRASGPEPLKDLFKFTIQLFKKAAGRKLTSLECHDLMCKIAEVIVVGGVRRSALISLSDLEDERMREAKSGQWWVANGQRALANNSAVYNSKPDIGMFMKEWHSLYASFSGERGIFSRYASKIVAGRNGRRDTNYEFSTNPCSEIILRPNEFCNLTSVVIRPGDSLDDLLRKVRLATVLGTYQSTLIHFPYLRRPWSKNTEEERLLGVSLTGICDHEILSGVSQEAREMLITLRERAIETNKELSQILGIPQSVAVTAVKPEGCVTSDSIIPTDSGIFTMGELFEDHSEETPWSDFKKGYKVFQESGHREITQTYYNGLSKIQEIQLRYGLTLRSTPNHKWLVKERYNPKTKKREPFNDYLPASEICEKDVLNVVLGNYRNTQSSKLHSINTFGIKVNTKARDIKQPSHMNPDIAWFIGYLWGDGCMSPNKYRLRFTDSREDNREKLKRIAMEQFGLDSSEYFYGRSEKDASQVTICSPILWHWLIRNDIYKYFVDSHKISEIPLCIRTSSKEDILAFYSGLFDSDGCVSVSGEEGKKSAKLTFTTSDREFAHHIQMVAQSVGLNLGCSHNTRSKRHNGSKGVYLLAMGKHTEKEALSLFMRHSNKCLSYSGEYPWQCIESPTSQDRILGSVVSNKLTDNVEMTFDISVPDNNCYFVGPVQSHNTSSQLNDSASGLHTRYARYYIRRVRNDKKDPLCQFMIDQGVPYEEDLSNPNVLIFSFPRKSPEHSLLRDSKTAIEQLELWKQYQDHWCEHKPSVTIYVKEHEWLDVGAWVYRNFDSLSGVSFLPWDGGTYRQAPYEEIDEKTYLELLEKMPKNIDWDALVEEEDNVEGVQSLSCVAGGCEI